MVASGFYKVDFGASLPGIGGIVVVEGGSVRGSDGQFLFSGKLAGTADDLRAVVQVKSLSGQALTVFGTHESRFELGLAGHATGTSFTLTGGGLIQGQIGIRIHGTKISELDF